MPSKAIFHMESGDFEMNFEGQKTFPKINKSSFQTLLLLESMGNMSDEFKMWLDCSLRHGNGPSVPRISITVMDYDENDILLDRFYCTSASPRRWFTKLDTIREIELDYLEKHNYNI